MGLEDCEEVDDDTEGRVQLDPSVWSTKAILGDELFQKRFNGMMPPENFMPHLLQMPNAMSMAGPSIVNPFLHQMANQIQQMSPLQMANQVQSLNQQQQQQQQSLNAAERKRGFRSNVIPRKSKDTVCSTKFFPHYDQNNPTWKCINNFSNFLLCVCL